MRATDRVHHFWVRPEQMPTEMPVLILEWRRNPNWEALVTYADTTVMSVADGAGLRPAQWGAERAHGWQFADGRSISGCHPTNWTNGVCVGTKTTNLLVGF